MKVAILAGGRGTRLSEETLHRPKPLVEIGGRPMLWHIMQHYAAAGFSDFVIAAGYKKEMVHEFARVFEVRANTLQQGYRDFLQARKSDEETLPVNMRRPQKEEDSDADS